MTSALTPLLDSSGALAALGTCRYLESQPAPDRPSGVGSILIASGWAMPPSRPAGGLISFLLLVIAEPGYLPLIADTGSTQLQVLGRLCLKTSIVVTTNRPVDGWDEVLGDTTVVAAILDRLIRPSVAVTLDGGPYQTPQPRCRIRTRQRCDSDNRPNPRQFFSATRGASMSETVEFRWSPSVWHAH